MLILLIKIIIAAVMPQMMIETPGIHAAKQDEPQAVMVLTVDKAGTISLGDGRRLHGEAALSVLRAAAQANPETQVYIQATRDVPYARVMDVMEMAREAGFVRIALITLPAP